MRSHGSLEIKEQLIRIKNNCQNGDVPLVTCKTQQLSYYDRVACFILMRHLGPQANALTPRTLSTLKGVKKRKNQFLSRHY